MTISYYLVKGVVNKCGEHPVKLSWCVRSKRLYCTIGISVAPKNWNEKRQRPKGTFVNKKGMTEIEITNMLDNIQSYLSTWYSGLRPGITVSVEMMKQVLSNAMNGGSASDDGLIVIPFEETFATFMKEQKIVSGWTTSTYYKYNTVKKHIAKLYPGLSLTDINETWLERYTVCMAEKINMQPVSIQKEHKLLKAFLKWAFNRGLINNDKFLKYHYVSNAPKKPVIYLTGEELKRLRLFEIPKSGTELRLKDKDGFTYIKKVHCSSTLDKARDLFLFASYTGLRFSDVQAIKEGNVIGDEIHLTIQKTQEEHSIDIVPFAREILKKYQGMQRGGYCLPRMTNQKLNYYLKDLFEIFGLNEPITLVKTQKGVKERFTYARWELMSTHAARRTFVCFALAAGLSPAVVAKCTGHSSLASMKPYMDIASRTRKEGMNTFSSALME